MPAVLLALCLPLASCGEGNRWSGLFNDGFRKEYIQTCTAEADRQAQSMRVEAKDWTKICTCMADHMISVSSNPVNLLKNANDDKEIDKAAAKCV